MSAFLSCTKLTSLTVPDGVQKIRSEAFRNCSSLASASLPGAMLDNVDESDVFYGTPALANDRISYRIGGSYITQKIGNYYYTYRVVDGKAVLEAGGLQAAIRPNPTGSFTLPSLIGGYPLGTLGRDALYSCSGLTQLTIPSSVTVTTDKGDIKVIFDISNP